MSSYSVLKQELVERGRLSGVFLEAVDGLACQKLWQAPPSLPNYEPLLIEANLESLWHLLERCLAYRKEARELEILAVKAAADYDLYLKLSELDRQQELLKLREPQHEVAERTQRAAARTFGTDGPLPNGFHTLAQGQAEELTLDRTALTEERQTITERFREQRAYEDAYQARHSESGNAHNYAERRDWLYRLLCEDLAEAIVRAEAIHAGLEVVYDQQAPLPTPDPVLYLDELVIWARRVTRFVEAEAQHEASFDLTVPLTQPWGPGASALVPFDDFKAALNKAQQSNTPVELTFDLAGVLVGFERIRLRAVGLAFGNTVSILPGSGVDRDATADSYSRLRATIFTPAQKAAGGGPRYHRPPIVLGNVAVFGVGGPLAVESGPVLQNVDPRGKWRMQLEPRIAYKDQRAIDVFTGPDKDRPLLDLKLHLRLAVANASGGWS
ncbi:hypothetical protein [Deinococcus phoenicis]|uniref:hypothetical protein n=1 Tax=Deinococcus phoenicis TaxID=1476583 RepID=UPI001267B331|nr:hypothetical protein [Deinococcus phoenicis]